jgi:hypothetical protein
MSELINNAIKVLESIKYFTVKRQIDSNNNITRFGFNGVGESYVYIAGTSGDTSLAMPEGLLINFRLINVHWGATFLNLDGESDPDFFWFEFSNGTNGLIKENFYRDISFNGEDYGMYIFYSDFYKGQAQTNPSQIARWVNDFDNQNYRQQNEERYFPMSMIITVKESDRLKFEEFMNMDYVTWELHFNFKKQRFLQYWDLELFDKYDIKIIVDYLSKNPNGGYPDNDKIIEILEKICDGWFNGIIPPSKRTELLLGIMSNIKTENAKDIFEEFFKSPSPLFYNSIVDNLDDDYKVQFIFLLMRLFYKQMSKSDLQEYENTIVNLPKNKILPFLVNEKPSDIKRGPYYNFEISNAGLLIKDMTFWVFKPEKGQMTFKNRPVDLNDPDENIYSYIHNLQFGFEELVGAIACFDKPDQGFNQLMVYPIPAFAFPIFHEALSDKYKLKDLLTELNTSACIIFPFFRIAALESIGSNIVALLFGIGGSLLKPEIKKEIQKTTYGTQFMYLYDIFSNFWVGKDLTIAVIIERGGLKAFADCENLLAAWSLFDTAGGYIALFNKYPVEAEEIKNNIEELNKEYEKAKKKK